MPRGQSQSVLIFCIVLKHLRRNTCCSAFGASLHPLRWPKVGPLHFYGAFKDGGIFFSRTVAAKPEPARCVRVQLSQPTACVLRGRKQNQFLLEALMTIRESWENRKKFKRSFSTPRKKLLWYVRWFDTLFLVIASGFFSLQIIISFESASVVSLQFSLHAPG